MAITVRRIVPVEERIKALIKKAKGREEALVTMLLAAFVSRWPDVPVQVRLNASAPNAYRAFLEPADPATQSLPPAEASELATLPDKEVISQLANQFIGTSWVGRDPRAVAVEVIFWGDLCSVNFVSSRSEFSDAKKAEAAQKQGDEPLGGGTTLSNRLPPAP